RQRLNLNVGITLGVFLNQKQVEMASTTVTTTTAIMAKIIELGRQRAPHTLYHQICAVDEQHRMASSANSGPLMNCPWPVPAMESMTSHQQIMAAKYYGGCASELNTAAEHQAVLIYKMQLLHCVEVATKRLLFHLVKTSASMPNLFR
uniref:ACOX domain-containing protein n=1 Tax=Globodera pallida TaxID=36090 RepID=A0A183CRB4_GLOPA